MFYFKKIFLADYTPVQLETSLRKVSLKRTSSLDLVASSTIVGTDKFFLGYEGKKGLTFTRIRYSIEKFLPKIIVRLSRDNSNNYYEMRFAIFSTLWLLFFTFFILMVLAGAIVGSIGLIDIIPPLLMFTIYIGLIFLEIKFTKRKVNKALNNNVNISLV